MTRFRQHLGNHRRTLLLLAAGAVMFLLWLGLWLRVLPDRPRVSIPAPEHTDVFGVSNDGRWIVTRKDVPSEPFQPSWMKTWSSRFEGGISVWDAERKAVIAEFPANQNIFHLAFSPDNRFLILDHGGEIGMPNRVFDTQLGRELNLPEMRLSGDRLCFSPDGRYLAGLRAEKHPTAGFATILWDLSEKRQSLELVRHSGPLSFSPDSSQLALVSNEGSDNQSSSYTLAPIKS